MKSVGKPRRAMVSMDAHEARATGRRGAFIFSVGTSFVASAAAVPGRAYAEPPVTVRKSKSLEELKAEIAATEEGKKAENQAGVDALYSSVKPECKVYGGSVETAYAKGNAKFYECKSADRLVVKK